jgi:hemolysin activation/secretion protein
MASRYRTIAVVAGALLAALRAIDAMAQADSPGLERRERPGFTVPVPGFLKPEPVPQFVLPPVAPETARPELQGGLRVYVKRIEIVGSTAFSEAQLRPIVAPFEGKELTNDDLDELRHRLSLLYAGAGYINSGAVVPDQDVKDGVIRIQIIEGRLAEVRITGPNSFDPRFIASRVRLGAGAPLNVRELQETIQLLLQNPQIERINAELAPGAERGEAVLSMEVAEARRWSLGFSIANNRNPAVGQWRGELSMAAHNLFGWGGALSAYKGHSKGVDDNGFRFTIPISAYDTLFMVRRDRIVSRVIEAPFNALDVTNRSHATEFGLSQPLYRTLRSTLTAGASFYYRDDASTLLGVPFSFVPGLDDGKANIAAARLYADWLDRTADSVFAARVTYTSGLNCCGGTKSTHNTPDSQYSTVLGQAQYARRLSEDGRQLVLRADAQHASGVLLPSEKFTIGGIETVRGYRENQVVRDNGWAASAEYRHPLGRIRLGELSSAEGDGLISAAIFVDAGRARDHYNASETRKFIWSFGPGLRWDIADSVGMQLYKGFRQSKIVLPGDTPQDNGWHFRFGIAKAF